MNTSATSTTEANSTYICPTNIPYARDILNSNLAPWLRGILAAFVVCCALSVLVFVEEIVFLRRNFRSVERFRRTVWILAVFPVFSLTSFLAILIPRSGTLINLVANTFFGSVIYQLVELIVDYLGGRDKMWIIIGEKRPVSLRTPPLCCCCLCLPDITLTRKTFDRFHSLVVQVTVVRPLLMFIAAVLWTDNMYIPGNILPSNAFLYLAIGFLTSTLLAVWGLVILKTAFRPELDQQFRVTGKIACIQLTLVSTAVSSIVCGILATANIIRCSAALGAKARGDVVFHAVVVVLMCPLCLLGRFFYRRADDGADNVCFEETVNIAASMCVADTDSNAKEATKAGGTEGPGEAFDTSEIDGKIHISRATGEVTEATNNEHHVWTTSA